MTKTYKVKEFSQVTSVTMRTLHYYDQIGLLKPSKKTINGHRVYNEADVLRLQQITTLKSIGFSLDEIHNIIYKPGFNVIASLKNQAKIISEEAERLQKAAKLLQHFVNEFEKHNSINLTTIFNIIEVTDMKQTQRQRWYHTYLPETELLEFIPIGHGMNKEKCVIE